MRRTVRRYEKEKEEEEAATAAADKKTRTRKPKEQFSLSFAISEDNEAPSSKTIFATSKATLNMPSSSSSKRKRGTLANKKEDYLLPDDKHFASQQLLTLFLKPKAAVNMKRRLQRIAPQPGAEVDERYWAAAAAAQAGPDGGAGKSLTFYALMDSLTLHPPDEDDDDYGPILPFDTQFFHDDGDTPDFDDDLPMGGDEFEGMVGAGGADDAAGAAASGKAASEEEDDLLKATQGQVRRARPVFVNYARKAKRVDVRKLKENIWKELALETPTGDVEEDEASFWSAEQLQTNRNADNVCIFDSRILLHLLRSLQRSFLGSGRHIRKTRWTRLAHRSVSFVCYTLQTSRDFGYNLAMLYTRLSEPPGRPERSDHQRHGKQQKRKRTTTWSCRNFGPWAGWRS